MFPMYAMKCPECGMFVDCQHDTKEVPDHYPVRAGSAICLFGEWGFRALTRAWQKPSPEKVCSGSENPGTPVSYVIPGFLS
jgi:hypothetical protein